MPKEKLPYPFESLEPFVGEWALASMAARQERRFSSTAAQRQQFYAAVAPLFTDIMDHLSRVPLAGLAGGELTLMQIALSFTEVSLSEDIYGEALERPHAESAKRIAVTKTPDQF